VTAVIKNSLGNNLERELHAIEQSRWEFSFSPAETANYTISMVASGSQLDGSPLNETIMLDEFAYPDEASLRTRQSAASEAGAGSSSAASAPAEVAAEPEAEDSSNVWLYVAIGVANLLVMVLGFVAYRVIAGKGNKDELAEMEKTLNVSPADLAKGAAGTSSAAGGSKVVQGGMPPTGDTGSAEDNSGMDLSMPDDLMADNLFPLDNMEDENDKNKT
jgi:hypothetical protein